MKKLLLRSAFLAVLDLKPAAILLISLWIIMGGVAQRVWAASAATSTTLAISSASAAATQIEPGSVVTLTATVKAGAVAVTTGQVSFCDATATNCTDIHLLGTRQLTSAGTAALRFVPGIGSHSYKALFAGTTSDTGSASNHADLTVTVTIPTTTSIATTGGAGNYTLRATVSGSGGAQALTGSVSFLDTSNNGNPAIASEVVGGSTTKLSFLKPPGPATGVGPWSVVAADFNGDGVLDLAVANRGDNSVTILLGAGDGTFSPAADGPATVGSEPISIAVGDFNGDGFADLAVANYSSSNNKGTVTVLLGGGDGSFTQASGSPVIVGILPRSVAVADFNGDGIADLAVANFGDSTVSILLGNGDGTFSSASNSPVTVGPTPYSVAVADFNGDGAPDLAVANGSTNTVTIVLGNGDGTFTAAAISPVTPGYAPTFVVAADFNGDGKTDLAAVNNGNSTVTIFLGKGDGSFSQAPNSPVTVGVQPYSVVVGDFDGDGIADLAVANACGIGPTCKSSAYKGTLTVLLGDGKGTFIPAADSPLTAGIQPLSLASGDFNGDGIADLAAANYSSGTVTVATGQWTQTATATASGIALLGTGTHLIDASYPGDDRYASSLSTTTGLTAQKGTPTVTVTPSSSSITISEALPVTVTLNGTPSPTGSVTLTSGSYTSALTTLANDSVQIIIPAGSLAAGSDTLTASYTPDSESSSIYNSASGTSTAVTVTPAMSTPTVTVTTSASSITTAQPLTVTVAVAGVTGNPMATGFAIMTSGTYTSASTTLSNGGATIDIPAGSLAPGSVTLTANYTPDSKSSSTYNSASGTSPAVTVTSAVSSSFTLTGTAVTFAPGATTGNTSTVTVTPAGGFTGSVALTALITASPDGAQNLPTLSFGTTSPASITGASAGTATLTISTTAATSATMAYPTRPGVPWYASGGTVLACILLIGIPTRRRRWRTLLGMLVFLVAFTSGVLACGGDSGRPGNGGTSNPGTTAGTYTVTFTGTSGTTTTTGAIMLTVQ